MKDALITGGSGMVGTMIPFGIKPTSTEMNITSIDSIRNYIRFKPSCIIHLASLNLRDSEKDISKSIDININGTINMLQIAMEYNIPFVFVSTGAVFSSKQYLEFDEHFKTSPNCVYGYTKKSGEEIALLHKKTILIRTGWLFGGNQKTHYKFVEHVIEKLKTHQEIKASNNFFGSPTYVVDLIQQMEYLIQHEKYGIHHVVNSGNACGYDIATEIASILNIDHSILSVSSDNIPNAGPLRSSSEILTSVHSFNQLRDWKKALKEYILFYTNTKEIIKKEQKWKDREICRLCNRCDLTIFFKLNPTPPANHFVTENSVQDKIPLDICICNHCKHFQLIQMVDPGYLYSNYVYVSSTSPTMVNHLKKNVLSFVKDLKKEDFILEIGANDGVCVKHLLDNGYVNIIGVDPAQNINKRHNLPILCDFFGSNLQLKDKYKLIYGFHCCAHIEMIQDVFKTAYSLLEEDGTFIIEVGYFYEVFHNNLFDTIYHEHIDYHTCSAMQRFAVSNHLCLYKTNENNIQGGSIQFFFSKKDRTIEDSVYQCIEKEKVLHDFDSLLFWKNKILLCGKDIYYLLNSLVSYGKKIVGYGASAKSTTFLHQYNISNQLIQCILDDNIYKYNLLSPGLHIPIYSIDYLDTHRVDYIIILSWNFKDEIIKKIEKYRQSGLRIIIPFPEIKIV